MRHLVSFLLNPFGYLLNLFATILVHAERVPFLKRAAVTIGDSRLMIVGCDRYCSRDGVQDDMLF